MNRKEFWNKIGRQFVPNVGTLILVFVLLWAQQAGALGFLSSTSSTTTISYQGRLANSGGTPVNDTVGMTFRIYNAATGGSPLWTETYPAVQINDGLFHVLLGSTTPLPQSLFSDNDTLYLGITVGADDEMTPREQLASTPWAMAVPDGSITSTKIADGAVTAIKAPSLIESVLPNTQLQYGAVIVTATHNTPSLSATIDFNPNFAGGMPFLVMQPSYNFTPYVIVSYGSPCDGNLCTAFIQRTDGGIWTAGQQVEVMWIALDQK